MTWQLDAANAAERAWFVYRASNKPPADYPRDMELEFKTVGCALFNEGARWGVVSTSKLSVALADLSSFLDWLRGISDGPHLDLEELRAAWRRVRNATFNDIEDWEDAAADMDILLALHEPAAINGGTAG